MVCKSWLYCVAPDIRYSLGHPGRSACNAVVSGVKYLSQFSWLDTKKIGLQGHSFGGYETNYIITHCQLFAAAMSASGPSDLISESGTLHGITSNHSFVEVSQMRIGSSLWERPDLYIENSPVLDANNVHTPLLLMHNPKDVSVPLSQSIEFFTALRRLGKRAWMLQYSDEGHNLENKSDEIDYTLRVNQYFDHFLKGAPMPDWMK